MELQYLSANTDSDEIANQLEKDGALFAGVLVPPPPPPELAELPPPPPPQAVSTVAINAP